jgi:XTP/dITP diphosphohydrolase
MEILIATNNQKKLRELHDILINLDPELKLYTLRDVGFEDDIIEDATTFEGNALIKVNALSRYGYITLADDSGLEVEYLNGEPGVYSARYAGEPCDDEKNNEKLLSRLDGVPYEKRNAAFVSAIACRFPDGRSFTVRGSCEGVILTSPKGSDGFGYDPLFLHEKSGKTFAELNAEEKNKISHRRKALEEFMKIFPGMLINNENN